MRAIEMRRNGLLARAQSVLLAITMIAAVTAGVLIAPTEAQAAPGDPILYGVNGFGTAAVTELDIVAQTATGVGDLARESAAVDLDPATGRLYFYEWQSSGNEFGYFEPASGASTIVRTYSPGPGHEMMRMAFAPDGTLYAMDVDDTLYTIDPATGDLSEIGLVPGLNGQFTTGTGDMSFADDGTLYIALDRNLYTVDVGSLTATLQYSGMIPVSGVGISVWTGLAHCDGVMYASSAEQLTSRAGIFTIDPATGDQELLFYAPSRLNDLASCPDAQEPVNNAPVADDGAVATTVDTPVAVTLTASDADADPLTYQVTQNPTNGALSGTAPNLTYTPNNGYEGTDTITFTANDGQTDSNTATITITITAPVQNNAPVADDDAVATTVDTPVAVTLTASDTDADPLTYQVTQNPTNGALSGTAPNLTYTPNNGYEGTDTITFTANDGQIDSNTATVTITVDPGPVGPGTPTDVVATAGDTTVSLSWQAPSDTGDSPIADYVIEYAPRGDSWATFDDGVSTATTAVVTGLTNYDEYRFRVAATNSSSTGTATIAVWSTPTDGNDPDETFNHPDGPLSNQPNWTEVDPIRLTDLQLVDGYAIGTDDPEGTGTALTTPVGPDVEVTMDALLGDSYNEASAVLRLPTTDTDIEAYLLQWVTDGDYVRDGTVTGPAIQIWRLDPDRPRLLADANLADNGERTLTFGAQGSTLYIAENGTVLLSAEDDTYPSGEYIAIGQADFSEGGTPSRIDNLRWETLESPNNAPVASDDTLATSIDEAIAVTLTATDADGDPLTYQITEQPTDGTLTGTAPDLTYTPNTAFVGTDTITFTANDGQADSNPATITITVEPAANNTPVANDDTLTTLEDEAIAVTLTATDADGDPLTYQITEQPTDGTLTGTAPDLTYTPNTAFVGTDTITFTANDGQADSNPATITITVEPAQDGPDAPTGVTATPGDGSVDLSWQAPTETGGSPITDYVVEYARRGDSWATFDDGVSTATTVTLTGLTNYDEYRFRISTVTSSATSNPTAASWSTPTDGNDPDETFNHPDGNLGDRPGWSILDPDVFADLLLVDGHVTGTGDPDGTGTVFTTPVGPDVEITFDALLGDDYNEASVLLRMPTIDDYSTAYLLQWVTDGDYGTSGTIDGPALQILRLDPGSAPTLLAEGTLANNGERTLTFGAQGTSLYIAEGDTVLLSTTDDTYVAGGYIALGQADLSDGGTPSQLDNFRYETLDPPPNTAPVANDDAVETAVDEPVAVLLSASDLDGDILTFAVTGGPTNGTLSGSAPNLTYTPDPGFAGTDTIDFVANDGEADSNVATVTVTVTEPTPMLTTWGADRARRVRVIDLIDGTSELGPRLSFGTQAMDRHPTTGEVYYYEWSSSGNDFASWDPDTGVNTRIRTYFPRPGLFIVQMAFAPDGTLYVIDDDGVLHTIDPDNGDITTLGSIGGLTNGPYGQWGDLAFAPDGTAYLATYDELYELDVTTRTVTLLHDGMFGTTGFIWMGLAYCDGRLFGSHVNDVSRSAIYEIDIVTGATTEIHYLPGYVADLTSCATN